MTTDPKHSPRAPSPLSRVTAATIGLGLSAGLLGGILQGCDPEESIDRIGEQCGLDVHCEAGGIAEGNAHISGIASIDAFFGAVIDVNAQVGRVEGTIRAELDAIAVSVGLQPGAAGADIRTAIEARLELAVDGGLRIQAEPARCEASVEVMAAAAAECDATVDPGSVEFACEGSCEVEAGVQVDCGAEAELHCTVTAPSVTCDGMCQGTCQLDAGGTCNGTCRGECDLGCSVRNADGSCNGECTGTCTGECELAVAAECEASCEGTCDVVEPSGQCEATAEAHCDAMAGGSVQCDAGCSGSAEPPEVSAECEASVDAKASASVQCTPPSVAITWQWSTAYETDLDAQAEFRGWITGLRGHYSAILAARAQGELLLDAASGLVTAAEGAVSGAVDDFAAEGNARAVIGARCALPQLGVAGDTMFDATTRLGASLSAVAEVNGALTGG